jgi:hypothetical protein
MSEVKNEKPCLLSFPDRGPTPRPGIWLWLGAILLFAVIHSPPARMVATFHFGTEPDWTLARSWICCVSVLLLAVPLAANLGHYARAHWRDLLVSLGIAAVIFPFLCLLIHPFSIDDHGKLEIARAFGSSYASMSRHPLGENNELFYRRLLQPLFAHWLHLDGMPYYGWFSLGCTFTLVYAQTHFLRMRSSGALMPATRLWQGAIVVLALGTCAQIMVALEWPGYPEQTAFLFLLIPAFVPMSSAARFGAVTLALAGFDGLIFPLAAEVLFCFPRRDRRSGFILIASYIGLFALSYGFNMTTPFELHETIGPRSFIGDFIRYPHVILFGIFAAFKFFWVVIPVSIFAAHKQQKGWAALGLFALTFSFAPLLLLAWDVTRLTAFSFVGLLFCVVAIYQLDTVRPAVRRYMMPAVASLSLLFPSYNIFLLIIHHNFNRPGTRIFREPGLYRAIAERLPFDIPDGRSPEEKTSPKH